MDLKWLRQFHLKSRHSWRRLLGAWKRCSCWWGNKVESGYTGGQNESPSYRDVCSGTTGHAEVVQVSFDPAAISYADILDIFFAIHDPTTLNRQGNDAGTQYRSVIFYNSPEQKRLAEVKVAELTAEKVFPGPIVTQIAPLTRFFKAEDYHQGYFQGK